jgi:hypothetical protein
MNVKKSFPAPGTKTLAVLGLVSIIGLSPLGGAVGASVMYALAPAWSDWQPDAQQAALWQEIQAARQSNLQQLQTLLATTGEALDQEGDTSPDLATLAAATEMTMDELIRAMRRNRDRFLALYAQLEPHQQAQVRTRLARELERLGHLVNLIALTR